MGYRTSKSILKIVIFALMAITFSFTALGITSDVLLGSDVFGYTVPSNNPSDGRTPMHMYWDRDATYSEIPIKDANDMAYFMLAVNINKDTFAGKTVFLTQDIDLKNITDVNLRKGGSLDGKVKLFDKIIYLDDFWVPIGIGNDYNTFDGFCGTFDGCGYTISSSYTNSKIKYFSAQKYASMSEANFAGIFGEVTNATIKNLKVKYQNVATTVTDSNCSSYVPDYTGILCGKATDSTFKSIVIECKKFTVDHVKKTGMNNQYGAHYYFGGLVGYASGGKINKCKVRIDSFYSSIHYEGLIYDIGGIAGNSTGAFEECVFRGDFDLKKPNVNPHVSFAGISASGNGTFNKCLAYFLPGNSAIGGSSTFERMNNEIGSGIYYEFGPIFAESNASYTNCSYASYPAMSVTCKRSGGIYGETYYITTKSELNWLSNRRIYEDNGFTFFSPNPEIGWDIRTPSEAVPNVFTSQFSLTVSWDDKINYVYNEDFVDGSGELTNVIKKSGDTVKVVYDSWPYFEAQVKDDCKFDKWEGDFSGTNTKIRILDQTIGSSKKLIAKGKEDNCTVRLYMTEGIAEITSPAGGTTYSDEIGKYKEWTVPRGIETVLGVKVKDGYDFAGYFNTDCPSGGAMPSKAQPTEQGLVTYSDNLTYFAVAMQTVEVHYNGPGIKSMDIGVKGISVYNYKTVRDANSGSTSTEEIKKCDKLIVWGVHGTSFTVTLDALMQTSGFVCDGYYDSETGGNLLSKDDPYTFTFNGAKKIYARYKGKDLNVTFNPNGETALKTMKVRYIRDWLAGSTANAYNHWVEIEAYDASGTNVALGRKTASSQLLTDGSTVTSPYHEHDEFDSDGTYDYVDLGNVYDISYLKIYHYYGDSRTYYGTRTQVSVDGENWIDVFDSESVRGTLTDKTYIENEQGNTIYLGTLSATSFVNKVVTYFSTYGNLPVASRIGYTFDGWETHYPWVTIDASTKVTTNTDHNIYAKWKPNEYSLQSFDSKDTEASSLTTSTALSNNECATWTSVPNLPASIMAGTKITWSAKVNSTYGILSIGNTTVHVDKNASCYTNLLGFVVTCRGSKYVLANVGDSVTINGNVSITAVYQYVGHTIKFESTSSTGKAKGGTWQMNSDECLELKGIGHGASIDISNTTVDISGKQRNNNEVKDFSGKNTWTIDHGYENVTLKCYANGVEVNPSTLSEVTRDITIKVTVDPIEYDIDFVYYTKDADGITSEYITETKTYTVESETNTVWFGSGTGSVYEETVKKADSNSIFNGWLIPTEYGSSDATDKTLTIEDEEVRIVFKLSDTISVTNLRGQSFYVVTGIEKGSYGNWKTTGDEPKLIIRWGFSYILAVDAEGSQEPLWECPTDEFGIKSYEESGDNSSITFNVKASDEGPAFAGNAGKAFYKGSNYEPAENEYCIYNYGYEVIGYKVYCQYELDEGYEVYYFVNGGDSWSNQGTEGYTGIDILVPAKGKAMSFAVLADYLDGLLYGDNKLSGLTIHIEPVWEAVKIQAKNGEDSLASTDITYGGEYVLNQLDKFEIDGKSIAYLKTDEGNSIIVKSGEWNYHELSHEVYDYTEDRRYIIQLNTEGCLVDNIYRVNLGTYQENFSGNRKALGTDHEVDADKTDYVMDGSKEYALNRYTVESVALGYEAYKEAGKGSNYADIEAYIDEFYKDYVDEYVAGLNLTSGNEKVRGLFRKIYTDDEVMYIYLSNGHITGRLPVFETEITEEKYLICWTNLDSCLEQDRDGSRNLGYGKNYLYKTSNFTEEHRATVSTDNYYIANETGDELWYYTDGYSSTDNSRIDWAGTYYRKVYTLRVDTMFNGMSGRYGYITIEVIDPETEDNTSANYIAVYNKVGEEERVFYYRYEELPASFPGLDNLDGLVLDDTGNVATSIPVFDGVDLRIRVYDQSKDSEAAKAGLIDDMVGYRSKDSYFESVEAEDRYLTEIEEINGYDNGYALEYGANFEKIVYGMSAHIDKEHGYILYTDKEGNESEHKEDECKVEGISLGDTISIKYWAYDGYELKGDAFKFVLENTSILLQSYEADGEQTYTLTLTGAWLREHYYYADGEGADEEFNVADVEEMGTIDVSTQEIAFKVVVISDIEGDTGRVLYESWRLRDGTVNLGGAFTFTTDKGYVYRYGRDGAHVDYAVLKSYGYTPKTPDVKTMYGETYSFKLNTKPSKEYTIDGSELAELVINGVAGGIIPTSNRVIYFNLEVREIYAVRLKVVGMDKDTYASDRKVILDSGYTTELEVVGNRIDETVTGYTYAGQTNKISAEYDSIYYGGVSYEIDGEEIDASGFEVTGDCEIEVRFIPNVLRVEKAYYLDFASTTEAAIAEITDGIKVYGEPELGSTLSHEISMKQTEYTYEVKLQGMPIGDGVGYEVTAEDYARGYIRYEVYITSPASETILITSNMTEEGYGRLTLYVDGVEQDKLSGQITEGSKVEVKVESGYGYAYAGSYMHGVTRESADLDGGKIEISSSFNPERDKGIYTINFIKTKVNVKLELEESIREYYTLETNDIAGETSLTDLVVGDRVRIRHTENDTEALGSYYYVGSGIEYEIEGESIEITSELLARSAGSTVTIKVHSIPKYALSVVIDGESDTEGLKQLEYSTDSGIELGGTKYYTAGSKFTFTFNISEGYLGKYVIEVEHATSGEEITLEEDTEIVVKVSKASFRVTVESSTYWDKSYEEGGEATYDGKIDEISTEYLSVETVSIAIRVDGEKTKRLTRIEITGNDGAKRVIQVGEDGYPKMDKDDVYTGSKNGDNVEIEMTIYADVEIAVYYTAEEEIHG